MPDAITYVRIDTAPQDGRTIQAAWNLGGPSFHATRVKWSDDHQSWISEKDGVKVEPTHWAPNV